MVKYNKKYKESPNTSIIQIEPLNNSSNHLLQDNSNSQTNINFFRYGNTIDEQKKSAKILRSYEKEKNLLISKVVPHIESKFNKMNDFGKVNFYLRYLKLCKIYIEKFNSIDKTNFSKTFVKFLIQFNKYLYQMNKLLNNYYENFKIKKEHSVFYLLIYTHYMELYLCNYFLKVINFEDLII